MPICIYAILRYNISVKWLVEFDIGESRSGNICESLFGNALIYSGNEKNAMFFASSYQRQVILTVP